MGKPKTLVSLPPEIRNRIYEFALNSDGALCYFAAEASSNRKSFFYTHPQPDSHSPTEFNQVKFVNRQLYSETAGLELKHCAYVVFRRTYMDELPPGAQAVEFLLSISANKRHWVSKMKILASIVPKNYQTMLVDTPVTLSSLDHICLKRRHLQIHYHPDLWYGGPSLEDYEHCAFIGALYSFLFRGDDKDSLFAPTSTFQPSARLRITRIFATEAATESLWIKLARKWRDEVDLLLQAPNFRFFPSLSNESKELVSHPIGLESAFIPVRYINPEKAREQIMT